VPPTSWRAPKLRARCSTPAAEMVARSGTLVFAVCSLEVEEGPEQTSIFCDGTPTSGVNVSSLRRYFGLGECINAQGDLRSLPCHLAESGGMDGFYAAAPGARLVEVATVRAERRLPITITFPARKRWRDRSCPYRR